MSSASAMDELVVFVQIRHSGEVKSGRCLPSRTAHGNCLARAAIRAEQTRIVGRPRDTSPGAGASPGPGPGPGLA